MRESLPKDSLESGVRSLEFGVWSRESGVWSLESGVEEGTLMDECKDEPGKKDSLESGVRSRRGIIIRAGGKSAEDGTVMDECKDDLVKKIVWSPESGVEEG